MAYPNKEQVSQFYAELSDIGETALITNSDTLECTLSFNNRSVRIKWFENSVSEFWFSMHDGERCDLVDWVDMLESEMQSEVFKYLKILATRYLKNDTRVVKKWLLFGEKKLQYFTNESWDDLSSPEKNPAQNRAANSSN